MASIQRDGLPLEAFLYNLAAEVLDIDREDLDPTKTFLALGGDSLSAIEFMGKCRLHEVWIEISDMMGAGNLADVVGRIIRSQPTNEDDQELEGAQTQGGGEAGALKAVESVRLYFAEEKPVSSVKTVLDAMVRKHTALQGESDDRTQQTTVTSPETAHVSTWIFEEVSGDERVATTTVDKVRTSIETEQRAAFGAVLCPSTAAGGKQSLVLMASPTVMDPTSWRIVISEVSSALGPLTVETFPAKDATSEAEDHRESTTAFSLGDAKTMLHSSIHTKLRTEYSDILNAALALAASELGLVKDQGTRVTHATNRRHQQQELREALGCFDEVVSFHLTPADDADVSPIQTIRQCKDLARSYVSNDTVSKSHSERDTSSLHIQVDSRDSIQILGLDISPVREPLPWTSQLDQTQGDIQAVAYVWDGTLKLAVSHSDVFSHHHITPKTFGQTTQRVLLDLVSRLEKAPIMLTLSDFPLLHSSYASLDSLTPRLPSPSGNIFQDIESIGPCSPMQDNFLVSQRLAPQAYQCRFVLRITSTPNEEVNLESLTGRWTQVVSRHSILRTCFIESDERLGKFDQLVWRDAKPWISIHNDLGPIVDDTQLPTYTPYQPPHRFSIALDRDGTTAHVKLDISHALMDGQSTEVLMRDVCRTLDASLPQTPALPYLDFAASEMQVDTEPTSSYWADYMDNAQQTFLPVRNTITPGRLDSIQTRLDFPAGQIGAFCGQNGVTPANVCQVAWGLVLKSFVSSAGDDVCFSYVTSRRQTPLAGIQEAVGPFLDVLYCRLGLGAETSVKQALALTGDHFLQSLPYQNITTALSRLQQGGSSVRRWGNTILSFHRSLPAREYAKYGLGFELVGRSTPTDFDVSLNIDIDEDEMKINLDFWGGKMDKAFAEGVLAVFGQAVRFVLTSEGQGGLVGGFSPLTEHGKLRLRKSLESELPRKVACVHHLVEAKASQQPEHPAVSAWDGDWTYEELVRAAKNITQALVKEEGVNPGARVAICMEKSKWAIAAMISVLSCGAAIVPIGIDDPRAADLITSADVSHVLVDRTTSSKFTSLPVRVKIIGINNEDTKAVTSIAKPLVLPSSLAWILYTSGSSGKPKGVMLDHSALCTGLLAQGEAFRIDSTTRALQFAAYTFADSIPDVFATLIGGGCVCVPSEQDRTTNLAGAMKALRVNQATLTNTVAGLLLDPKDAPKLRRLVLSGEMPSSDVVAKWAGYTQVINGYGQSEASVFASCGEPITDPEQASTIGFPISGRFWLVQPGDASRLCPPGAPGELVIESHALARGYLNDPERSADAFLEEPTFLEELGGDYAKAAPRRMYRTGDIVRQSTPDGPYVFIGRLDTQVKIRGQRVELGEIEAAVAPLLRGGEFTAVSAALVTLAGQSEPKLVAALELSSSSSDSQDAQVVSLDTLPGVRQVLETLQNNLIRKLPVHMVPTLFIPLSKLPTNASKKIDRPRLSGLLEAMDSGFVRSLTLVDAAEPDQHPRTDEERQLQALWGVAFGREPQSISVRQNFFQAGGDSVTAVRMVAAARSRGVALTVAQVFKHASIRELAEVISAQIPAEGTAGTIEADDPAPFALWKETRSGSLAAIAVQCGVNERQIRDIYPATPLQEGLMAITTQRSRSDAYVLQRVYRVGKAVDVAELRAVWGALVACTPIFRTRLALGRDGSTVQVVVDEEASIEGRDDISLPEYLEVGSGLIVDYGKPLSRVALVKGDKADKDQWFFVWTIHHSLFDGWSTFKTLELLNSLWNTQLPPSSPVPIPRLIRYLTSHRESREAQLFWRGHLAGVTKTKFPALPDSLVEPTPSHKLQQEMAILLSRKSSVTTSTLLRATWAILLASYSGEDQAVMMLTLSGRNAPVEGIVDLLAPTLTSVPFRVTVRKDQPLLDFLNEVQGKTTEMIPFEHTGLQHIRRFVPGLGPDFDPGHVFTIQTTSAVSSKEDTGMTPLSERLERLGDDKDGLQSYALTLDCIVNQDAGLVTVEARFDDGALPDSHVQAVLSQFGSVFSQLQSYNEASGAEIRSLDLNSGVDLKAIQALQQSQRALNAEAASKAASTRVVTLDDSTTESDVDTKNGDMAEERLQRIWSEALRVPLAEIKLHRSFLSYGGDSIAAIKVVALCRAEGMEVTLRNVLQCRGIADLAQRTNIASDTASASSYLDSSVTSLSSKASGITPSVVSLTSRDLDILAGSGYNIKPADIERVLPCSPFQQGILFQQLKSPESYSICQTFRMLPNKGKSKQVHVGQLVKAWQSLQARHSIMRTVFVDSLPDQEELLQLVLRAPAADVLVKDCPSDIDPVEYLDTIPAFNQISGRPPHRFTVVQGRDGSVLCRIETTHALVDAVSFEILTSQLLESYESDVSAVAQTSSDFGQYVDYVRQREAEEDLQYWTALLADAPSCILPQPQLTEKPQSNMRAPYVSATMSALSDLNSFQTSQQVTVATVFQLAWAVILSSYTGTSQVSWGGLFNGREVSLPNAHSIVGPMINQTIHHVPLGFESTVAEAAKDVQRRFLDAFEHQNASLAAIQHALKQVDTGFFNTLMSYRRKMQDDASKSNGGSVAMEPVSTVDPTEYDISVQIMVQSKDEIEVVLQYSPTFMDAPAAKSILDHYLQVVRSLAEHPTRQLGDLLMPSEADLKSILSWNKGLQLPPVEASDSVHGLVQGQLRANPDKVVVDAWDGQLTGRELDEASDRLAIYLKGTNVLPSTPVGFCMSKSKWAVVAMLGILKAGGAVVPLGVQDPIPRIETIQTNCGIKTIVLDAEQIFRLDTLQHKGVQFVNVHDVSQHQQKLSPLQVKTVTPTDIAFIMHTSGSTGTPKGVVVGHDSLSASMKAWLSLPQVGFTSDARVLQFTSFTFDPSNHEVLSTLYAGGCVCVPSEHDRVNDLERFINEFKVTAATLTPSVARMIAPEEVPSLKALALMGEAVKPSDVEAWLERGSEGIKIVNAFGPTETTIIVSASKPLTDKAQANVIGYPLSGMALWVVHPENFNNLCPVGVAGELLAEGPLVAAGYLHDAEQTSASFITDPEFVKHLGKGTGRRMYRTGDIVRQNPDGSITYLGRRDNQVKVNGQRVEISEIENTILRLGSGLVRAVCVSLVSSLQQGAGEKNLIAAVEVSGDTRDTQPQLDGLRRSLLQALPSYMVPSLFIPVAKVPLTSAGKVDRRAVQTLLSTKLDESDHSHTLNSHDDGSPSEPLTGAELQLQTLWASVLNKPQKLISRDDDFFRIGGDSIGAMKLVAAARRAEPPVSLTVATVFQHARLTDLAQIVSDLNDKPASSSAVVSSAADPAPFSINVGSSSLGAAQIASIASHCQESPERIQDVYPCAPLQEGMLAITTRRPGKYVLQRVFRLSVQVSEFKALWERLYRSLAVLRTRIVPWETGALQAVVDESVDWRSSSNLAGYLRDDLAEPMTYGSRLCRICVVEEQDGSAPGEYVVLTMHHSIYDGWSMIKMMDMLDRLAHSGSLPPTVPMSRFIHHLSTRDEEATATFWRTHLGSANVTKFPELPVDPSYLPQSTQHATRHMIRSNTTKDGTQGLGSVTVANILRAAWAILLNAYANTDTDEVLIMVAVSGRQAPVEGILDVAGPTVATVPVRVQIPQGDTVPAFLSRVQQDAVDMVQHEHTGLQNVKQYVPELEGLFTPAHLFTVQAAVTSQDEQSQVKKVLTDVQKKDKTEDAIQGYAFNMECSISSQSDIGVDIWFDDSTIPTSQVHRMLGQYEHIFQQLCLHSSNPSFTMGHLSLVSPEDHAQIQTWNQHVPERTDKCIHEILQDIADAQPDAPAVCSWDGDFTYREFVRISSRLAHHLRRLDSQVGPDELVGLCMSKSKWALVAAVAILQAGAGVVPLGIGHPTARIQTIMDNTQARFILVDKEQAERLAPVGARTIIIDEDLFTSLPPYTPEIPCPDVTVNNTSYVVFTSGSTGTPKGSILEHGALASSLLKHSRMLKLKRHSRALQFAAFTFDNSISDIFATLFQGGCVCEPSEDDRVSRLAGAVHDLRVNFLSLTPTVAALLRPQDVPPIEVLVVGGEPLDPNVIDIWGKSSDIINSYGPSECSILVACSRPLKIRKDAPNVGLPVACCFWVVSPTDYNRLSPIGAPGELLLQGPQLGRGYINEPEKTAKAFVTDPRWVDDFPTAKGHRLYRSGDLVRQNEDQSLTMLGRRDTQLKIHGQRVEVGEIESWIVRLMPEVRKAAVDYLALTHGRSDRVLIAALELEGGGAAGRNQTGTKVVAEVSSLLRKKLGQLRTDLRGVVPSYMIPMIFVPVVRLPLNPSSKLDRLALRNALGGLSADDWNRHLFTDDSPKVVNTEGEATLRKLWAAVLSLTEELIGRDDNLFEVGGDSVVAMRLTALAREEGMQLTVADILRNPVLKEMAAVAGSVSTDRVEGYRPFASLGEKEKTIVLEKAGEFEFVKRSGAKVVDAAPTTDFQGWSVGGMLSETRMDVNYVSIDGKGKHSVESLRRALLALVRDVEILRTAFILGEDGFCQIVLDTYEPDIRQYSTTDKGQTIEGLTQSLIKKDIFGSPELGKPPVDIAIITSSSTDEHRILLRLSHALYDAHSLPIVWDGLKRVYNNTPLKPQPSSTSYMHDLHSRLDQSSLSYWSNLLRGSTVPQIGQRSASLPEQQKASTLPKTSTFTLPASSASGMMPAVVVKAAWGLVLAEHSGLSDVTFGEASTGRNAVTPTVAGAYGCCVTALPFRFVAPGMADKISVSELLDKVWSQQTSSIQHETVSTSKIVRTQDSWDRFTSLINHQRSSPESSSITLGEREYTIGFVENENGFYMMPDVSITATQGSGTLEIGLAYAVGVVSGEVAGRLHGGLDVAVEMMLKGEGVSVKAVREAIRNAL